MEGLIAVVSLVTENNFTPYFITEPNIRPYLSTEYN
jgi:hypothetical protein